MTNQYIYIAYLIQCPNGDRVTGTETVWDGGDFSRTLCEGDKILRLYPCHTRKKAEYIAAQMQNAIARGEGRMYA